MNVGMSEASYSSIEVIIIIISFSPHLQHQLIRNSHSNYSVYQLH